MDHVERPRHGTYHWIDVLEAFQGNNWWVNRFKRWILVFLTRVYEAAVNVQLTPEEIKYLEEPYTPRSIIGHT